MVLRITLAIGILIASVFSQAETILFDIKEVNYEIKGSTFGPNELSLTINYGVHLQPSHPKNPIYFPSLYADWSDIQVSSIHGFMWPEGDASHVYSTCYVMGINGVCGAPLTDIIDRFGFSFLTISEFLIRSQNNCAIWQVPRQEKILKVRYNSKPSAPSTLTYLGTGQRLEVNEKYEGLIKDGYRITLLKMSSADGERYGLQCISNNLKVSYQSAFAISAGNAFKLNYSNR